MKMKNKKSVCSQLQKNIVIINLLLIICSGSYAEVPLTDQTLSEQSSDSKHLDAETIQRAQNRVVFQKVC